MAGNDEFMDTVDTVPTMSQTERFFQATLPNCRGPRYSMASRTPLPEAKSKAETPGPYDIVAVDVVKRRQPTATIKSRSEMVIGGNVPSWTRSIPGPKYDYDLDVVRPRAPTFVIRKPPESESPEAKEQRRLAKARSEEQLRLTGGLRLRERRSPAWAISGRTEIVMGGDVPSWKRSIPGPYTFDPDVIRSRVPTFSIGRKLPSESDLMKQRSPGPMRYSGAAVDAKAQSCVDSTKRRSFTTSFGQGPPRFAGKVYKMGVQGALARYDRPVLNPRRPG